MSGQQSKEMETTTPSMHRIGTPHATSSGPGVRTLEDLKAGLLFGPCDGVKGKKMNRGGYRWEVSRHVDASDPYKHSWMRRVNCAPNAEKQNLVVLQHRGEIYYRTTRDVKKGEELLIWCGDGREFGRKASPEAPRTEKSVGIASGKPSVKCEGGIRPGANNTEGPLYACDCGKSYLDERGLEQHRRETHGESPPTTPASPPRGGHRQGAGDCPGVVESGDESPPKETNDMAGLPMAKFMMENGELFMVVSPPGKANSGDSQKANESLQEEEIRLSLQCSVVGDPTPFSDVYTLGACTPWESRKREGRVKRASRTRSNDPNLGGDANKYMCGCCGTSYALSEELKAHVKSHNLFSKDEKVPRRPWTRSAKGPKGFECGVCHKEFRYTWHLKDHMLTHSGVRDFMCDQCGRGFFRESQLRTHLRRHVGPRPYQCGMCRKTFCRLYELRSHVLSHEGHKPYQCDTCKKCFALKCSITTHVQMHNMERLHQCGQCKKRFQGVKELKAHLLAHKDEKRHKCPHCDRSYYRMSDLNKHVLVHVNERQVQCKECGDKFSKLSLLKKHRLVHSGVMFQCEYCGKVFGDDRNKKRHLRTHMGKKPYVCKICGQMFVHSSALRSHQIVHYSEEPYECSTNSLVGRAR